MTLGQFVLTAAAENAENTTNSVQWLQWVLPGIFGGGLITAIGVILRLRPEATSAAVAQANGAMEVMKTLIDELKEHREEQEEKIKEMKDEVKGLKLDQARLRSELDTWQSLAEELQNQRKGSA